MSTASAGDRGQRWREWAVQLFEPSQGFTARHLAVVLVDVDDGDSVAGE